ncbi:hypothetical protein J2741_000270 [Methanolinea mesophila]|uniref:hypothetical protein n=1 Tax=Methanolinea mesophila TaxID=547055 RepID=UPI001AE8C635|nr:hypothetical protein [Methanolinea mesophila]MBP1927723.1 hypothetical protein [Methanolinea mesophila]
MVLTSRIYGHSLSSIEKELIFSREDTGYVRSLHTSGALFSLDPSPFLQSPKRVVYIAHCTPPENGTWVFASVYDEKQEIMKDRAGYYTLTIKYVDSWSPVDPSALVRPGPLSPGEVHEYFTRPYLGEEEIVDGIALCSALYSVSSPPLPDEKGGVHAAVLGKKRPWQGFKKSMGVIPREFSRETAPVYYSVADREKQVVDIRAEEINLAYLNPETFPMHIPVVLDEVEVRPAKEYTLDMQSQAPLVTAFLLDSLMVRPAVPESLSSSITDTFHALIDEFKSSGWVPYKQDFGSLVPRLGMAFARYHSHRKVSRDDLTGAVDLWSDMYYRARKVVSTQYEVSRLFRLDDRSRRLYLDLVDAFQLETPIPLKEARRQAVSFRNDWEFEEALDTLNRNGLLIRPGRDAITILDNRPVRV